ncbi:hypothetical protein [Macrococcoides caseolyticum]|uniref:hypothetical protein n=1 Tax=Macrococcoides caseolyticum TaxID=69966 RepID=UPI0018E1179E|nr:hypothetical protein [Macrococcus caseolyticus]QQB05852.1 hypothetical protein I6H62_01445 [Macrococcus caseolyticus]
MKIFDRVTRKDLVYIILMLFIILIAVFANFLGNDDVANNNINFAATIVSIILGVIAILYSLMDSTGQKESVNTLTNVTNTLAEQSEKITIFISENEKLLEKISEINDNITSQKDLFKEEMSSTQIGIIDAIKNNEGPDKDKVVKIVESEFNKLNDNLLLNSEYKLKSPNIKDSTEILEIRKYIANLNFDKMHRARLERLLCEEFDLSIKEVRKILKENLYTLSLYYNPVDMSYKKIRRN